MQLLLFYSVVWIATDENYSAFSPIKTYFTQSLIHLCSIQQTFKHMFNIRHFIYPSAFTDSMGRLKLKLYINAEMN